MGLSDAVVAAVKATFEARTAYNAARTKVSGDLGTSGTALLTAQAAEAAAERALHEHLKEHGCKR